MLKSNSRRQLASKPRRQLYDYNRQLNVLPRKRSSHNRIRKFSYYHLIAIFMVGLLGGYAINNFQQDEKFASQSSSEINKNNSTTNDGDSGQKIDEQKAFNLVWNLPQVQHKAQEIEKLSQGTITVAAAVDSKPTANSPFYIVQVFEQHPHQTTTPIYWFRVYSSNGVIEPLDWVKNQYIPLEEWNPDGRV